MFPEFCHPIRSKPRDVRTNRTDTLPRFRLRSPAGAAPRWRRTTSRRTHRQPSRGGRAPRRPGRPPRSLDNPLATISFLRSFSAQLRLCHTSRALHFIFFGADIAENEPHVDNLLPICSQILPPPRRRRGAAAVRLRRTRRRGLPAFLRGEPGRAAAPARAAGGGRRVHHGGPRLRPLLFA